MPRWVSIRIFRFDGSFVSPQAFLLRKSRPKTHEDILPFFADSINKKFHVNAQQEEIARLTQSTQELQRKLESQISKRDQEIQNFRSTRQQLQEALEKQQTEINQITAERDQALSALDRVEGDRRDLLAILDKLMAAFLELNRQALATKEAELTEQNARIESLELAQSGLFWELLLAYRRLKDRCLPDGTRRRAAYDRGLARLKALKTEVERPSSTLAYPAQQLRDLNGANTGIDGSIGPATPRSAAKILSHSQRLPRRHFSLPLRASSRTVAVLRIHNRCGLF